MKRAVTFIMCGLLVMGAAAAHAAETMPLGAGTAALKIDYLKFTDSVVKNTDADTGLYLGMEVYGNLAPRWYLGAEVGYANPDGTAVVPFFPFSFGTPTETEVTFVPVEVNMKYAVETARDIVVDYGAGLSYNFVKEEASALGISSSVDDWLLGGQVFVDLSFKLDKVIIGVNGKYQITEDFKSADYDYNNWRLGGRIGLLF